MTYKQGIVLALEAEQEQAAENLLAEQNILLAEQVALEKLEKYRLLPFENSGCESSLSDIKELNTAIESQLNTIDKAFRNMNSLSAIADTMNTFSTQGIDRNAAAITAIGAKNICGKLGIRKTSHIFALEAFGTSKDKISSTQIAKEDFIEFMKSIWEAIVAAFKQVSKYIVSFLLKLFDNNRQTSSRAKSLKKALKEISHRSRSNTVVPKASYNLLLVGGLIPHNLGKSLQDASTTANSITGALIELDKYLSDGVQIHELVTKEDKFNAIKSLLIIPSSFVSTGEFGSDGLQTYKSRELPGNKSIVITAYSGANAPTGIEAINLLSNIHISIGKFNEHTANPQTPDKLPPVKVLTNLEMEDIVNKVIDITDAIEASKATCDKLEATREKWIQELNKLMSSNVIDEASSKRAKLLQKFATNLNRISSELIINPSKAILELASASLDYVEKSYSEYDPS